MVAILHTRSGKRLKVDVVVKDAFRDTPIRLLERHITEQFNTSGMIDRVIRTEIPLFKY